MKVGDRRMNEREQDERPAQQLYLELLRKTLTASVYPERAWKPVNWPDLSDVSLLSPLKSLRLVRKFLHMPVRALRRSEPGESDAVRRAFSVRSERKQR